jgi:hypothetical protein
MKKEENAFPALHLDAHQGMTLRDYFAAKAMQGFISNALIMQAISEEFPDTGHDYLSNQSYEIADAMLKQREL